jgi:hypothetical protein
MPTEPEPQTEHDDAPSGPKDRRDECKTRYKQASADESGVHSAASHRLMIENTTRLKTIVSTVLLLIANPFLPGPAAELAAGGIYL